MKFVICETGNSTFHFFYSQNMVNLSSPNINVFSAALLMVLALKIQIFVHLEFGWYVNASLPLALHPRFVYIFLYFIKYPMYIL